LHVEQFAAQSMHADYPPGEYCEELQALHTPLLNPKLIGHVKHEVPLLLQVEQF